MAKVAAPQQGNGQKLLVPTRVCLLVLGGPKGELDVVTGTIPIPGFKTSFIYLFLFKGYPFFHI
jgi:hypothetical protein